MSFFDIFGKNTRPRYSAETVDRQAAEPHFEDNQNPNKGFLSVFTPKSYDDVQSIIDVLKTGKTAIVHTQNLKPETAVRVRDILSGAIYALGGGFYEADKETYIYSPNGLEINRS